jgi:hypothetical protein
MSTGHRTVRRSTFIAFLASVSLATVSLAGCVQIPTSGPVIEGDRIEGGNAEQIIRVIARPPQNDMTPAEIVSGFVSASASVEGDYAVARQYLTPEAAARWDPTTGTTVYDGTLTLNTEGRTDANEAVDSAVLLSAAEAGRISAQGRYQVSPSARTVDIRFPLTTVNGQWRIASPPTGLLLSRADIDRAYRSYNVYFPDPSFSTLVPDPRLLPVSDQGVATLLVQALVQGPTDWLAPAVRTGFPDGSSLLVDSVPIVDGVARVDLDPSSRLTDDATRQAMSAQLVWTLRQVPTIQAVDLAAGGQTLTVPGVANPQPRDSWAAFNPNLMPAGTNAFAVIGTRVAALTEAFPEYVPGAAGLGEPPLQGIAVSLAKTRIAGLDAQARLWSGPLVTEGVLQEVISNPGQSRPSFGGTDFAWVVSSNGRIRKVDADGVATDVPLEGLTSRSVVESIAVSRDGTRAALVTRRGPRAILFIGIVVQRESGPIITSPVRAEARLSDFLDVVWAGDDRLIALAAEGASPAQVYEIDLARATVRGLGAPDGAARVAAAPGFPVLVSTSDGRILSPVAGRWDQLAIGSSPTYPGG